MKKVLLILLLIPIFMTGCKKENAISKLKSKIEALEKYELEGELEIVNNEDIYKYIVESAYKKDDLYRVSLKNINNNHIQILLKNKDGVYVMTPSLNKSFKFQSDWPYNNSQIYLLQTILKDILDDKNAFEENNIITSKVKYTNNDKLVKQKVYLDKDYNIDSVEVMDSNNNVMMRFIITKFDERPNFKEDYFDVSYNTSLEVEESLKVSKIDSIIYPMYIPEKTFLASQKKINLEDGERVILTFDGDNPFMLIQETSSAVDKNTIIPTYGSFGMISDTIGIMSDNSVTWSSNGMDYYLTSSNLSEKELLNVASSVTILPVGK